MPASVAFLTALEMACASGAETARPSTLSVTAATIICACCWASLLDSLYLTVIPRSLPASSAQFLATDQNETASPCVITAIVMSPPWVRSTLSVFLDSWSLLWSLLVSSAVPQDAKPSTSSSTSGSAQRIALLITSLPQIPPVEPWSLPHPASVREP